MVIDSSAVLAILFAEPEAERFATAIAAAGARLVSTATWVELGIVLLARKRDPGLAQLEAFAERSLIERVPVDNRQATLAIAAFGRFGKGRHSAGLNLGDCFAYALAKATDQPLLFKGADFSKTDIVPAV